MHLSAHGSAGGRRRREIHCPCRPSRSDPLARPPPAFACGRWPPAAPNSGPRSLWRCSSMSSGIAFRPRAEGGRPIIAGGFSRRSLRAMPLRASARRPKSRSRLRGVSMGNQYHGFTHHANAITPRRGARPGSARRRSSRPRGWVRSSTHDLSNTRKHSSRRRPGPYPPGRPSLWTLSRLASFWRFSLTTSSLPSAPLTTCHWHYSLVTRYYLTGRSSLIPRPMPPAGN